MKRTLEWIVLAMAAVAGVVPSRAPGQDSERPVVAANALLTTPVGGLERTQATASIVPVSGQGFASALRVKIGASAPDSNVTQLTIRNAAAVKKGDALLASISVR